MRRPARAYIDLAALRHNLAQARDCAPRSRVVAMVKADAYGHGLLEIADCLSEVADALGVACVSEALALRDAGIGARIVVTQGFKHAEELHAAAAHALDVVVHAPYQLTLLEVTRLNTLPRLWVKVDTGMHRLGFPPAQAGRVHAALSGLAGLPAPPGFMTHFACADDPGNPLTGLQLERFAATTAGRRGECSLANSAAVLALPAAHRDWVRPGVMLYGSSPLPARPAETLGLRAVMHLRAPLIAINRHPRGATIGYGADFVCPEDMPVGVVGIGYGDGYPRHADSGTPVWVGGRRAPLAGRVSMDMLTIDLRGVDARVGDDVELWGQGVPADEVAAHAQTISYELFCSAGSRTHRLYSGPGTASLM
ncbi:alanine racemase [Acidihalobacter ferrooxydans]|uniref:Alanine racemase n=1 Tax=Acidihalobacter ferrooxydans TaxID=1765967 RepID=A0A1P8UFY9_9GAMM|nr:alanine racemase [Acidihalobacter ferrooxydans]APZ42768.1 alanine racemase [Acidihalobacter ferrooxydans]